MDGSVKAFISYSRRDKEFVRGVHEALVGNGIQTWVDWQDIPPTADFLREIYAAIEGADVFLFVISPASVTSRVCASELAHAIEHHKRLVPVLHQDVDQEPVPASIAPINWILWRATDDADAAVSALLWAIRADLDWLHAHTRMLVRALEWRDRGQNSSLLLRGRDLREQRTGSLGPARAKSRASPPFKANFWTPAVARSARAGGSPSVVWRSVSS